MLLVSARFSYYVSEQSLYDDIKKITAASATVIFITLIVLFITELK